MAITPIYIWVVGGLFVTIALSFVFIRWLRVEWFGDKVQPPTQMPGAFSPFLTWLKARLLPVPEWELEWPSILPRLSTAAELSAIVLWALWVGRSYLDFDPHVWPAGTGMGAKVLGHYFWINLKACGLCALWNDTLNGGAPALADRFGSQLHPLVMVTTLIWGVMVGVKIATIGALAIAGVAQWWIGRTLHVGRAARLWSAGLAVAGGHLATTQDEGNFGILLSTAMASLALAAALSLGVHRRRRDTVLLACIGAMVVVSGQGYLQLALLSCAPAFLFFVLNEDRQWRPLLREYALAVGICLLLIGIWLMPVLHFWSNFNKDNADPGFGYAQPLEYAPLNLVIRDMDYYRAAILGKQPHTNVLYIGWIPVLCAILCLRFARRENYPALLCLASTVGLIFFVASAIPLRWLARWFPFFLGFRFSTLMTGLAVAPTLGLAAYGIDGLLRLSWPQIGFYNHDRTTWMGGFSLRWLIILLMLLSLRSVYKFSKPFYFVREMHPIYEATQALWTPNRQWVAPPYGQYDWIEPTIANGMKVTNFSYSGAGWSGRNFARPYLIVEHQTPPADGEQVGDMEGIPVYRMARNEYAYVDFGDGQIAPCEASGRGGDIIVKCNTDRAGQLIVQENAWHGWNVWRDQEAVSLLKMQPPEQWLSVAAPTGTHEYRFRYLPWDVFVGLIMSMIGFGVALALWFHPASALPVVTGPSPPSNPPQSDK